MDHIQSLILVITWKDAGDRTIIRKAFRAIGYAMNSDFTHPSCMTRRPHRATERGLTKATEPDPTHSHTGPEDVRSVTDNVLGLFFVLFTSSSVETTATSSHVHVRFRSKTTLIRTAGFSKAAMCCSLSTHASAGRST